METEYHGQLSGISSGILVAVLYGGTGHFADCDNFRVGSECHIVKLFQIFVDIRAVCVIFSSVPGFVVFKSSFADQVDHVETETADAFIHPEPDDFLNFFPYIFIVPVQVRLCYIKEMEIIFIKLFYVFPGISAEFAFPVCGRHSLSFSFAEKEEIFVIRISVHGFPEPFMTCGYMVEYHVKHQTDPPFLSFVNQFFHICHCTISGINIVIVFYIISVVILRGNEKRGQPDIINAKFFDIIQFFNYAAEVAQSVVVRITE